MQCLQTIGLVERRVVRGGGGVEGNQLKKRRHSLIYFIVDTRIFLLPVRFISL